jgi:CubicO group peptidase (beta-lactamase class C family)
VQEGVDKHEIPGAVVLLARRGRIGYLRSFGSRDPASGAPMTDDAIFRIASMTKPVTTAAAMILVDEGRLDIDAPVSRYLPAFKDLMVGVETKDASGNASLALEPALREMTVRDLMRHTSGLTYGFIGKSLVKDRYNAANLTDPGQSNADLAAKLARLPLQSQPGTVWQYSMSADVLGRVVEIVSGMELDAFFKRRIFAPLGMNDTGFWVGDPAKRARIVGAPVDPSTGKRIALPDVTVPSWQSGGGGLVSTARDYARFCQMLLNGGELDGVRILSRRAVDAMTRDQLPAGIPTLSSRIPAMDVRQEVGNGFGLGVMVRTAEGLDAVRGSVGAYTWSGGLGTYFWVDPRQELVGIILFQTPALVRSAAYWVRLRNLAYEALANP